MRSCVITAPSIACFFDRSRIATAVTSTGVFTGIRVTPSVARAGGLFEK